MKLKYKIGDVVMNIGGYKGEIIGIHPNNETYPYIVDYGPSIVLNKESSITAVEASKFEKQTETVAEIIVDLYELRATVMPLFTIKHIVGLFENEDPIDLSKYNFITTIISHLCDKYKVKEQDIEKVMRERSLAKLKAK